MAKGKIIAKTTVTGKVPRSKKAAAIAGSSGFGAASWAVDYKITIEVYEDRSVWFTVNKIYLHDSNITIHGSNYVVYFASDNKPFTIKTGKKNGKTDVFKLGNWPPPSKSWSGGSSTKHQCDDDIDKWSTNKSKSKLYYYIAIPIDNTGGNINRTTMSSVRIEIKPPDSDEITGWYPWSVYLGRTWCSLDGPKGYLQSYSKRALKNYPNGAKKDSRVFVYSGGDWKKCPLVGDHKKSH